MRKTVLIIGVSLFVLGSALILGSFFLFNKSYLTGSKNLRWIGDTISFPDSPILLNEGDTVTLQILMNRSSSQTQLYISSSNEGQVYTRTVHGNSTVYYAASANDFYSFSMNYQSGGGVLRSDYHMEVVRTAPNQLFLVLGILILISGSVSIPIAFLHKDSSK